MNWANLVEGARSLVFARVRWERVTATPARIAMLAVVWLLLTVGFQRVYVGEGALFDWKALTEAGFALALLGWAGYAARAGSTEPPAAAQVLTVLLAQLAWLALAGGIVFSALLRAGTLDALNDQAYALVWMVPVAWAGLAQLTVLRRAAHGTGWRRLGPVLAVMLTAAGWYYIDPSSSFWRVPDEQAQDDHFAIGQEMMEAQAPLLEQQIGALKPQRPGVIDMYTITFAPYEGQEVFRRESMMVADVMATRFDAAGRGLQLLNHRDTVDQLPWATPLNLHRAIDGIAAIMDRDEDVLFIHLTSHGASDGELAAQFAPMEVAPVMPAELRQWLDHAGIRYRVISISACFAGNWIAPLRSPGTLVMTASDADHTSYGCGGKSELTFFGRAMYDEQLRKQTLSFEQAHAAARKVILAREQAAGKDDGYSNPQIDVGATIAPYLERQRRQLSAAH